MKKYYSVQRSLFVCLILVGFFCVCGMAVFYLMYASSVIKEVSLERVSGHFQSESSRIESYISYQKNEFSLLLDTLSDDKYDSKKIESLLATHSDISTIFIHNGNKTLEYTSDESLSLDIHSLLDSRSEYFSKEFITDLGTLSRQGYLFYGGYAKDETFVVGGFKNTLQSEILESPISPTTRVQLIYKFDKTYDGVLVPQVSLRESLDEFDIYAQTLFSFPDNVFLSQKTLDNIDAYHSVSQLASIKIPHRVVIQIHTSEVMGALYTIRSILLKTGVSIMSIVFLLSYWLSHWFTQPIRKISQQLKQANGKPITYNIFDETLKNRNDEIGILVSSFHELLENILDKKKKVKMSYKKIKIQEKENEKLLQRITYQNDHLKEFASLLSHDLKAPVRGISNLLEWIKEDIGDAINPETQKHLTLAVDRSAQLSIMIKAVLEYSIATDMKEHIHIVDVEAIIQDIQKALDINAYIKFISSDKLPLLRCNQTMIYQIFQNLITNAIEHGNNIKPLIKVGYISNNQPYFYVQDNGSGIAESMHKKIFNMFQTSFTDQHHSGIGLSIVQRIVTILGGKIWVENNMNEPGAIFKFTVDPEYIT